MSRAPLLGPLALAALLLVLFRGPLGCGAPPAPTAVPARVVERGAPLEATTWREPPTPEQERALANALHQAHLLAGEPVGCADCHATSGAGPVPVEIRCGGCHEDHAPTMHAAVSDPRARDCLGCHDFAGDGADPWVCAGCHVEHAAPPERDGAPKIRVHEGEACGACHVAHGEAKIAAGPCQSCHEELRLAHDDPARPARDECRGCHDDHAPAAAARATCAGCHDEVSAKARFAGHDDCTTCHAPHERGGLIACESCHADAARAARSPEHRRCASCHEPHAVRASPAKKCAGCHDEAASGHPVDPRLGACGGCHEPHREESPAKSCAGCHAPVPGAREAHVSQVPCASCHPSHGAARERRGAADCAGCHDRPVAAVPAIHPIAGHSDCASCHVGAGHFPGRPVVPCASCHEVEARSAPAGHDDCRLCHEPHRGQVEKTCADCHVETTRGPHAERAAELGCATCHRAHGPGPTSTAPDCASCHERRPKLLHWSKGHQDCADCHSFHDVGSPASRGGCLGSCHQDQVEHVPEAGRCVSCHPFEGSGS